MPTQTRCQRLLKGTATEVFARLCHVIVMSELEISQNPNPRSGAFCALFLIFTTIAEMSIFILLQK